MPLNKDVPEKKLKFVVQRLRSVTKVDSFINKSFVISEEQQALVDEEYRKFEVDPNYGLDWEEVKDKLFAY